MKTKTDKINRLYDQLSKSLDKHPGSARTLALSNRLQATLSKSSEDDTGAIFAEECRSLISEAKGDLENAIRHREDEIRLIRRLHEISHNTPTQDFVLGQYGYQDLADNLGMLAILYHDSGDLGTAIRTLEGLKQTCVDHGLAFEGEGLLSEYLKEAANATFYLRVSENGVLAAEQVANEPRESAEPTSDAVAIRSSTQESRTRVIDASQLAAQQDEQLSINYS